MRRRLGLAAILATATLLLAGCAPAQDSGGPDPVLLGQWELQGAKDAQGSLPLVNQHITLTIGGDRSTSGRSSCSDYTAHLFGTTARLSITAKLSAIEMCDSRAQERLDTRYIHDLEQVRYSSLTGGVLTFHSSSGTLTFARAIYVPLTLVTSRTWHIQSIAPSITGGVVAEENATGGGTIVSLPAGNNFAEFDASGATLRFSRTGSLTGGDECRSFSSAYDENAGELVIANLKSAKFGCNAQALEVDAYLMNVITSGFTWQSANGLLVINSPRAGVQITFVESPISGSDIG